MSAGYAVRSVIGSAPVSYATVLFGWALDSPAAPHQHQRVRWGIAWSTLGRRRPARDARHLAPGKSLPLRGMHKKRARDWRRSPQCLRARDAAARP